MIAPSILGRHSFIASCGLVLAAQSGFAADDPLSPWRECARVSLVAPKDGRHTIHAYYTASPESPDGSKVLYFASSAPDGQKGDVVVRDRASGEEKVIAADLKVEDAHRVACQQWVSKGRRVVYHGQRGEEWYVGCVDIGTMKERVLATGQLAGWGQPNEDVVPLYGLHWNPGEHRGLDLVNAATGEKRTVLTVDALKSAYPDWFAKSFGNGSPSIFFPVLSPDLGRVFFKMALSTGGDARSAKASARQGLICYSLAEQRFLFMNANWGHPGWHPDTKTIVEVMWNMYDSDTGKRQQVPGLPPVRGDHPSVSPDGRLIVTDTTMDKFGGSEQDWGIVLADARGGQYLMLHRFPNSRGAKSWRRSHPHPSFSADGKRIYFNVSSGPWTQLCVAEIP